MRGPGFWNLPNILTLCRIALVPCMVAILWEEPSPTSCVLACVLFVGAMITDIIDGWLARKWGLVSPMGAFLDPLADKLMVITVLIMLVPLGWVPAWLVALLLCRELTITGLRTIAVQEGLVIAASSLGKFKTAYQSTAIGFLLVHHPVLWLDPHSAGIVLLYIATFFALISAAEYLTIFIRASAANSA